MKDCCSKTLKKNKKCKRKDGKIFLLLWMKFGKQLVK